MIEPVTEIDLKPCPFCGQERVAPQVEARDGELAVFVHCYSCGGHGAAEVVEMSGSYLPTASGVLDELTTATECAAEAWNMRAKK